MKITFEDPNQQSVILTPLKVFECVPCKTKLFRKSVMKRLEGNKWVYYHPQCGRTVQDITHRTTAQSLIWIMGKP